MIALPFLLLCMVAWIATALQFRRPALPSSRRYRSTAPQLLDPSVAPLVRSQGSQLPPGVCVGMLAATSDILELHHEQAGDRGWIRETAEHSKEFRDSPQPGRAEQATMTAAR